MTERKLMCGCMCGEVARFISLWKEISKFGKRLERAQGVLGIFYQCLELWVEE